MTGNCSAEFCGLKLERGDTATRFSEFNGELTTINQSVSNVTQTADSLTSTVTTIQNQINNLPLDKTVIVDATSLDITKYYPVSIKFNYPSGACPSTLIRCKVYRGLDASYGVPSYGRHTNGFICDLDWTTKAGGWGANTIATDWSISDPVRIINDYFVGWVNAGEEVIVGSIRQNYMQSVEIVYVRGGSKYDISIIY